MNPELNRYSYITYMDSFFGFHSLIPFLKETTLANSLNSKGTISQILGSKYEILSLPWKQTLRSALQNLN